MRDLHERGISEFGPKANHVFFYKFLLLQKSYKDHTDKFKLHIDNYIEREESMKCLKYQQCVKNINTTSCWENNEKLYFSLF